MNGQILYDRPPVTDYQRAIMDCPQRFAVVEASTKAGKTASMIIWLFEQALQGHEGQDFWWIAPIYGQAEIAFNRMKRQVTINGFFAENQTALTLTLPTGSRIAFKSADKPDSLYGEDVYAAVFDEFTRAKEESWYALRSTLTATRGKCKFIGNVRGRGWGYKLAQRAKNSGDNEYTYFKITAWDAVEAGILERAEVEQAKRDLPEHVFRELYLAEPSDDGGNPFGVRHLEQARLPYLAPGPVVCYGVDLAKTTDYTVIIGLNGAGQVCHFDRFKMDWGLTRQTVADLPDLPTCIDSTGVGDPIVEELQRSRKQTEGFKFTSISKQQLIEGLVLAIQQGKTAYPANTPLEDELFSFSFEHTRTGIRYEAPSGLHDDCVMAYALAWRKHSHRPPVYSAPKAGRLPFYRGKF